MNAYLEHEANAKLLAVLSKPDVPVVAFPFSVKDPYMEQVCHPDIVERIWDQIGKVFVTDARCLVYGRPALVDPATGIIVAVGYGTRYCVRIPVSEVPEAINLGASISTKWSSGETTNIQDEFGEGWVFGAWLNDEAAWCQQASNEVCV